MIPLLVLNLLDRDISAALFRASTLRSIRKVGKLCCNEYHPYNYLSSYPYPMSPRSLAAGRFEAFLAQALFPHCSATQEAARRISSQDPLMTSLGCYLITSWCSPIGFWFYVLQRLLWSKCKSTGGSWIFQGTPPYELISES